MRSLGSWLDRTPLATIALELLREATGRADPLEPLRPTRPAALPRGKTFAFWSLAGGVGTSTLAALVAHRSAAGGAPPLLVDLDRWSPSLALRAKLEVATVTDALLRPGREASVLSRWSDVPFLAGAPALHRVYDGPRICELIRRAADGRAAVIDLGAGADALDPDVLDLADRIVVACGTRVGQLQAAFCAADLLGRREGAGLVVVGSADEDAKRVAARLPWPLLATIPTDPFLAGDDFAARAPTLRAIDALIGALS